MANLLQNLSALFINPPMEDGPCQIEDDKAAARRDRWRRNKRAQRIRNAPQPLPPVAPAVNQRIWAEKEKRQQNYPHRLWNNPDWIGGRGTFQFQCEVWAVRTLLEVQSGRRTMSSGKVARWMFVNGLDYGYTQGSLRTMVYRAFIAIRILETAPFRGGGGPHWPPFEAEERD